MIQRLLIYASLACCALVLLSFAMFARDQVAGASKHQQSELVAGQVPSSQPAPATHRKGQPRRFIDGLASTLTSPFKSLVQSDSQWALHALPAVIALLVYGVGLGYLARFAAGRS